jgi:ribonuclease HIII
MGHALMETPEYRRLQEGCSAARATLTFLREIQYGIQLEGRRGTERVTINLYRGKKGISVVVQGSPGLAAELSGPAPEADRPWKRWIGSDESGKGDYFGPLVVAAASVDASRADALVRWGVRDSKELEDPRIATLAARIGASCPHAVVAIAPADYNARYRRTPNVNSILGRAHAEAIEETLRKSPEAEAALADRFGDESYLLQSLRGTAKKITIVQRPKAESDPAVAAASVLARAGFVRALDAMSEEFGFEFPKGAGEEVLRAGRDFVGRFGRNRLAEVAKVHFRTTRQL